MRKKTITLTLVLLFTLLNAAVAQKLTVESMTAAPMDLSASQFERKDLAGQPCGLVKVQLAAMGATFEGNIVGQTEYKTGEYWVYMSEGAYMLTVKHPSFLPLNVNFRDYGISGIIRKNTYVLTLPMPQTGAVNVDDDLCYLVLTAEPTNAVVFIDDQMQTVRGGSAVARLPRGTHTYRVDAPGFASKRGEVQLDQRRESIKVSLESAMARVNISCPTKGAVIYVNEMEKGVSPWTGELAQGNYLVEARLTGYVSQKQSVSLKEREQRSVVLPALLAETGSLDVSYLPVDAEVWLDGRLLGLSPNIFQNISVGTHALEVKAQGYQSLSVKVVIKNAETTEIGGELSQRVISEAEKKRWMKHLTRRIACIMTKSTMNLSPSFFS